MSARDEYGNTDVCVDCYFAHHYGMREHEGQWFAGESDTPADRKPLALLEGFELADNTDSETGEGIDDFSWSSCEGCGSTLGGARYRLALFGDDPKLYGFSSAAARDRVAADKAASPWIQGRDS